MIALLLTASRGSLLALVIAGLYMLANKYQIYSHIKYKLLAFSPFIIMYSSLEYGDILIDTAGSSDLDTGRSRLLSWYAGISLFRENIFFGVGPGNFVTSDKATSFLGDLIPKYRIEVYDSLAAHSNYIEIATESGIFALIIYLSIFIYLLKLLDKYQEQNPIFNYFSGLIVATMVATAMLSYYAYFYYLLLGIIIYTIDQQIIIKNTIKRI